jgi:hypothetical protein
MVRSTMIGFRMPLPLPLPLPRRGARIVLRRSTTVREMKESGTRSPQDCWTAQWRSRSTFCGWRPDPPKRASLDVELEAPPLASICTACAHCCTCTHDPPAMIGRKSAFATGADRSSWPRELLDACPWRQWANARCLLSFTMAIASTWCPLVW